MTVRTAWLSLVTVGLLSLGASACAGDSSTDTSSTKAKDSSSADVDTPALRAQKSAAGIEACPETGAPAESGGLPDVTLPCLGGGPDVDLGGLRGPAVVNLWATYCGPCRSEAPILQEAHEKLAGQLEVLGVDYQEPQPGKAIAFADELGLTYPVLSDPDVQTKPGLRVNGLPITVLVDADGAIVYRKAGALESEAELADLLSEHLGIDAGWADAS